MALLQISSAQGPLECQLAVAKALRRLQEEAAAAGLTVTVLELVDGDRAGTLRSVFLELDGEQAHMLATRWVGTLQWVCASPFRPRHARKNWFIGVESCAPMPPPGDSEVRFEAIRARGPGGQHVNKTSSAIRATHLASGISVRVESERSQHANKRMALQLLAWRLQQQAEEHAARQRHDRRMQHHAVERGNPTRVFRGEAFTSDADLSDLDKRKAMVARD